ncbi:putative hydrolase/acyltransferase (alpha/beta hydrolase superfamily) [Handroanthus impetiginosus]|uniref:Putative hydrolase/acyltransferase (Alpha/beta hydrolase superfamily) n=1 Tax=Handroanthus impetiginosus TaxID=429701 RepID=A0A2G9H1Q6_9LAMI|nr:putative hydrolase/acyltransferase (alpha/beta hydrolase superfamily) [Handroanthus impetiginosus]
MGNKFICMTKKDTKTGGFGSKSKRGSMSRRRGSMEEELLHKQALAMAIQQHQLSQRFDNGSMSRRIGSTSSRRRAANLSDPFSGANTKQLPEFLENIKTKKFVLVHGEGLGAWCWYKTMALLEETGLLPIALDLKGCGINITDSKNVMTMEEYSKPLIDFLQELPEDEKVILVGHSSGGACVSYALEHLPQKISKAIYLCGTMISDGQRPFDVFAEELGSAEIFSSESKSLIYGNGKDNPPTGFMFEKQHLHGLYFNQSPAKDVALAMVSMRPIPLGPMMEKLSLTKEKYGTCRRFYIQTLDDHALSPDVQEKLVRENSPEGVFKIKGSDHCPFFSKPQSLHKILLEIAQIP